MLHINKCLSEQELDYIQSLPDVLLAKEKLDDFTDHGAVYFKITLTEGLKSTLSTSLALDLSNITEIPVRWIKGDTMRHTDKGKSEFTNTYLVYLTDSSGEFVLDDTAFPIQKNSGFIFNEGILHQTMNTGLIPRLLLGPMNEFAEPVGYDTLKAIYYYSTQAEAESASATDSPTTLSTNSLDFSSTYIVGDRNSLLNFTNKGGLAVDNSTNNVFLADTSNYRIRKIEFLNSLNVDRGLVSTFAGDGAEGYIDGPRETASFMKPLALAFDTSGNLFVQDGFVLRVVRSDGMVITLAGDQDGFADGTGTSAAFSINGITNHSGGGGIALDTSGNLFLVDSGNHCIRKVSFPNGLNTNSGVVSTLAGGGYSGYADDTGINAIFNYPSSIAINRQGNIFVTDYMNRRIRKLSPPSGLSWNSAGAVINASTNSGGGIVTTIFGWGNSQSGFYPTNFSVPTSIVIDNNNNLYTTNSSGLWKISPPAGSWSDSQAIVDQQTGSGGGIGTQLLMGSYTNISIDKYANIYFTDLGTTIFKRTQNGRKTRIAGTPGVTGYKDSGIQLPTTHWKIASSSTGTSPKVFVWDNGYILDEAGTYFLYPAPPGSVCFLEGTTVLCFSEGKEQYVPVEKLRKGTLVKTLRDGYKRVELVAKEEMVNPGTDERIEQRLYKCSTSRYPELTSDLYITGCHSILVNTITDDERAKLVKHLDRVFVTDRKYRLIACVDERAEPWNSEGTYTVWHFALEHENIKMNYGVFVNGGLLVESCSKHVLKNKSDMALV